MKTFTSWNGSKNLQDKIEKLKKKFFLTVKATFLMIYNNFTQYFERFIILSKD